MPRFITPSSHQAPLPEGRLILRQAPDAEAIEMDVVFVGGGPAGLAGAIELARLVRADAEAGGALGEVQIAVLEKAPALGEHNLSGAVVNPVAFRELFPELKDEDFPFRGRVEAERVALLTEKRAFTIPTPPTMRNHGFYLASISEIVRWLGEKAEGLGVNLLPGFPVDSLLVEGARVIGVRTTPAGLTRDGEPGPRFEPPTDITARCTVLAEGTRGALSQAYMEWQGITSRNPQIFALGVKEVWETKMPLDRVIHTLGWPLPRDAFGGSFMYPLAPDLVALGLVVGLDYRDSTLDVHQLLQRMKLHPLFREYLEGGEMVEWGAKTIPEGGYHSLPNRRFGDGLLLAGDAAGFVEVASLKGIHYAMQSGIFAARAIFNALKQDDFSEETLRAYDRALEDSFVIADLYRTRNVRLAFKRGFYLGGARAALMTLTGGRVSGAPIEVQADAREPKRVTPPAPFTPDGKLTFSKTDAVFRSGNQTRDDIPSHLIIGRDISPEVAEMYEHLCPAGVYERQGDRLVVNAPNCIDCKATDVLGPRWTPREGGSGPRYKKC
jgi:electron-transferring-flavoprotein dehydrogenase